MRQHPDLETLISKETDNPTPRAAAKLLKDTAPAGVTDAVLFANRQKKWVVLFTPSETLANVAQAARVKVDGKRAVATCPLS